jgi:hypothetical protein
MDGSRASLTENDVLHKLRLASPSITGAELLNVKGFEELKRGSSAASGTSASSVHRLSASVSKSKVADPAGGDDDEDSDWEDWDAEIQAEEAAAKKKVLRFVVRLLSRLFLFVGHRRGSRRPSQV